MILFPAIDLKDGKCVRLFQGRFSDQTVYGHPTAMAKRWEESGASWIHLVDLDGSRGQNQANIKAIKEIRTESKIKLQLGGGLKTMESVNRWFETGLDRLIFGTVICENPKLVEQAAARYPGKIVAALDSLGQRLRVWGWERDGQLDLFSAAVGLKDLGVSLIIHTDVERDGAQEGPNVNLTAKVAQISSLPTIISGGISGIKDLEAIKQLSPPGIIGVISGKALYEGKLDFEKGQKILSNKT